MAEGSFLFHCGRDEWRKNHTFASSVGLCITRVKRRMYVSKLQRDVLIFVQGLLTEEKRGDRWAVTSTRKKA
jgi:hypothetical protein